MPLTPEERSELRLAEVQGHFRRRAPPTLAEVLLVKPA